MPSLDLPTPDADARVISERLRALIAGRIAAEGPLRFDRYWEAALYQPGLGYYSAGASKLGPRGDFVTSPELGDVFARCLAAPVAETLAAIGGGDILEAGPGSGALACDLLKALEAMDRLPRRYRLLELSADLKQRQRQRLQQELPHLIDRIEWLEAPPTSPFKGLVLGNEVIDALPARRFRRGRRDWQELAVTTGDAGLDWHHQPPDADGRTWLDSLEAGLGGDWPEGFVAEWQPGLGAFLAALCRPLAQGRALFIDYGYPRAEYYRSDRTDGTLICHYRQRAHADPFWFPGLNDLSVNVDFTAVAEGLDAAGLEVDGFNAQSQFLIGCGLGAVAGESTEAITQERVNLVNQIKMLTLPGAMGERFWVITAARGVDGPVSGFQVQNRLDRL